LDADLISSVIAAESNFDPKAISKRMRGADATASGDGGALRCKKHF
jgi:soluble lytic murein transglycosylase-like protein